MEEWIGGCNDERADMDGWMDADGGGWMNE